jgi:hypothetical protein
MLLKKENATVDIRHFVLESAPELANPSLDMDAHVSNLKGVYHACWYPEEPPKSAKAIWDQYNKMKQQFPEAQLLDVEEPHLW